MSTLSYNTCWKFSLDKLPSALLLWWNMWIELSRRYHFWQIGDLDSSNLLALKYLEDRVRLTAWTFGRLSFTSHVLVKNPFNFSSALVIRNLRRISMIKWGIDMEQVFAMLYEGLGYSELCLGRQIGGPSLLSTSSKFFNRFFDLYNFFTSIW